MPQHAQTVQRAHGFSYFTNLYQKLAGVSEIESACDQTGGRQLAYPLRCFPCPLQSIKAEFAALEEKGESEFGFWIPALDIPTLKAVIRKNGYEPAKALQRWTAHDKFAVLAVEQMVDHTKRGAAFPPPKGDKPM